MIRTPHQHRRGEAFTLRYRPEEGPATSATVKIVSAQGSDILEEAEASIGDVETNAAFVRDSAEVTVTSAAGISAGWYWAQRAAGDGYPVEVRGAASTTVYLRSPALETEAGKILDFELSKTVGAVDATHRDARVVWTYTVGGVEYISDQTIDIVRIPFALEISQATIATVEPEARSLGGSRQEILRARHGALDQVMLSLRGHQVRPDLVIDRRLLEPAAAYYFLALRHHRKSEQADKYWDMARRAMDEFYSSNSWYDSDDDLEKSLYYTRNEDGVLVEVEEVERMPPRRMIVG